MLIGPKSTKKEQQNLLQKNKKTTLGIAQPMINLSRVPTISDDN
jgi:uncharacterized circularly permuted ATP-grasp superfamily protein